MSYASPHRLIPFTNEFNIKWKNFSWKLKNIGGLINIHLHNDLNLEAKEIIDDFLFKIFKEEVLISMASINTKTTEKFSSFSNFIHDLEKDLKNNSDALMSFGRKNVKILSDIQEKIDNIKILLEDLLKIIFN